MQREKVRHAASEYYQLETIGIALGLDLQPERLRNELASRLLQGGFPHARGLSVERISPHVRGGWWTYKVVYPTDTCDGRALDAPVVMAATGEIEEQVALAIEFRRRLTLLAETVDLPI